MLVIVASILFALVFVSGGLVVDGFRSKGIHQHLDGAQTTTIHVAPGDTLWTIAEQCGAGQEVSVADAVTWIRAQNGLDSSALRVGQSLQVPVLLE